MAASVLILGGTGYLGQRLVGAFDRAAYRVRVLTRRPYFAQAWLPDIEIVVGDAFVRESLCQAMVGVSHVIVCVRLPGVFHVEKYARLAKCVMDAATMSGVVHVTWIAPLDSGLEGVFRSHKRAISVFFLRSGPILGSGSRASVWLAWLRRCPAWVLRRYARHLVGMDHFLSVVTSSVEKGRQGKWRLPNPSSGIASGEVFVPVFTPDTGPSWRMVLPDRRKCRWTPFVFAVTPSMRLFFRWPLADDTDKPGSYKGMWRLMYMSGVQAVWESRFFYPFSIRLFVSETPQMMVLPFGFMGWVMGWVYGVFFYPAIIFCRKSRTKLTK